METVVVGDRQFGYWKEMVQDMAQDEHDRRQNEQQQRRQEERANTVRNSGSARSQQCAQLELRPIIFCFALELVLKKVW